jgi:hypothetical protein
LNYLDDEEEVNLNEIITEDFERGLAQERKKFIEFLPSLLSEVPEVVEPAVESLEPTTA